MTYFSAEKWNDIFTSNRNKTAREISEITGKSVNCVMMAAKAYGRVLAVAPRKMKHDWEKIFAENEGVPTCTIAKKFNLDSNYVSVQRSRYKV